jgi:hypothetical protein
MSVEQYSARFMELARFAANLIHDEETKAERFENGLNPRIKERVICLEIKDFAKLVEVASLAKRGMQESTAAYELKKHSKQQMTRQVKRLATGSGARPPIRKNLPSADKSQGPPCDKCAKSHPGECWVANPKCFTCGKTGHFERNFPKKATQQQNPAPA